MARNSDSNLLSPLNIKPISQVAEEAKSYIKNRKEGKERSLKVESNVVNKTFMDGFDWGRIITVAGLSGCLHEDTLVTVNRGKRSSGRHYTIGELYSKFHNDWNKEIDSKIRVYKEDIDTFSYNKIEDVVYSGIKPVFKVKTKLGYEITATGDHKFLTELGPLKAEEYYIPLKDLQVGEYIVVRKRTFRKKKKRHYRKSITGQFKYYANARTKLVEGKYTYFECLEQRALYDAALNGFSSITEFLKLCCSPNNFIFSDLTFEIHHKDGNTKNNVLSNLELLSKADHLNQQNNLYKAVLDEIVDIQYLGEMTTYDICCKDPYNNFVANNFVVHNSGKSTLTRQWLKEMIEQNPTEEFDVLSFQFEMLGVDEVARDITAKTNKSIKELYSAEGKLSDADIKNIETALDDLKKYPIYVVDNLGTTANIIDTILHYVNSNKLVERKRGLVVSLDHLLLVKSEDKQDEKATIDNLMHGLVGLKKVLSSIGLKVMFFVLSQLNRNIETPDRVMNPKLHYPNKNDLFAASSIYYSSDYVIIIHRPCLIDGLGDWYGPNRKGWERGLPVFNPESKVKQPMIYLHVIKERFGNNRIIPMLDNLSMSKIVDFKL